VKLIIKKQLHKLKKQRRRKELLFMQIIGTVWKGLGVTAF